MNINGSTPQQSALSLLYPQPQQELKSNSRVQAESENPVEEAKEGSNEQQETRTGSPGNGNQIDTYA